MIPKPFWGYPLQKAHVFLAGAVSLALVASACSSSTPISKTVVTPAGTGVTVATGTGAASTTPGTAVAPTTVGTGGGIGAATTTPLATTATTTAANATDWEVVVGTNFATQALATAQITKLTAAAFTGFSTKKLATTYAVVLPGLTMDAATALAAKINAAKVGTATTFHLTTATTPTASTTAAATGTTKAGSTATTVSTTGATYEVVAGIFSTSAKAQAQIDKLTKATFTGFTIKQIGTQFAVVLFNLTNAQANDLAKKVTNSGISLAYVKNLA